MASRTACRCGKAFWLRFGPLFEDALTINGCCCLASLDSFRIAWACEAEICVAVVRLLPSARADRCQHIPM